jgi:hypothetical protein
MTENEETTEPRDDDLREVTDLEEAPRDVGTEEEQYGPDADKLGDSDAGPDEEDDHLRGEN